MDQEKGLTQVIEPIENMMKRLNVNAVFGEPIKEGDQTIIPVASVSYGFGFGAGYGSGQSQPEEEGQPPNVGEGGGSGAGAMGRAKPVGRAPHHGRGRSLRAGHGPEDRSRWQASRWSPGTSSGSPPRVRASSAAVGRGVSTFSRWQVITFERVNVSTVLTCSRLDQRLDHLELRHVVQRLAGLIEAVLRRDHPVPREAVAVAGEDAHAAVEVAEV